MVGVLVYLYFLIVGYGYSKYIFKNKDLYFNLWMGGTFGNVLLMAGIVLPALVFDFTFISHFILIFICGAILGILICRRGVKELITFKDTETCGISGKVMLFLILPISLLIWVIMTNHILTPIPEGGVASGQCTFGDLQMHLGFITSIAEQKTFPPNYPFLNGFTLNYPFFSELISSSMLMFGTSLRLAVLIPSYCISGLLVMGFYIVAYKLTGKKSASTLSTVLFFLGGGFGFAYFLNGAKADINIFTNIFTGYYQTPTNLPDYNLRWVNPICDMIVPQRTTMAGWCMLFPTLWLMLESLESKNRKYYIMLGILAGCMPMIHTHSFLALGIISAGLFFICIIKEENKKEYIKNWLIYGGIVFIMAAPQLFYWTFRQSVNNDSFLRLGFNWVNESDPYLWFYLKNWGIVALFALPAVIYASGLHKRLIIACGIIFILAEFILFQPNEYDNNKLFFVVYMILIMAVSNWLVYIWNSLKGIKGRGYIAALILFFATFSGILSIIREFKSGGDYQTFTEDDIKTAEYIRNNIPANAVFLTSTNHLNPVVTLAGRNIYSGSSLYVYFHGFTDEFYKRSDEISNAYSATFDELNTFCKEKEIDYILISDNEKSEYIINEQTFQNLEKIYETANTVIYKTYN